VGIIFFLLIYGVLQERIMTQPYDQEVFDSSLFLVLCNRLLAVVCSLAAILCRGESLQNAAPKWQYALVSMSNVGATACQYEALKYVSFAVQMLGKSFKMLPVMIWSMNISGAQYGYMDWSCAAVVTLGVAEFLLEGPTESRRSQTATTGLGYLFILGFLIFDGATSALQEKLFKEHRTSRCNQMFYVNLFSSLLSSVLLLLTGSAGSATNFFLEHRDFAMDTTVLSAAAVASQYFIYAQVQEFGALAMAATMNVRQICAIICSYAWYGHFITNPQIFALSLVFSALTCKAWMNYKETPDLSEKLRLLQAPEDSAEVPKGA